MNIDSLQTIGVIIWWSEGSKSRKDKRWKSARSYPVEVTNTNPQIIRAFLMFLREVLKVPDEKLALQLQVHDGDDVRALENYWSEVTGIKKTKFNKTIVRPVGNKVGKSLGTCKVRFSDKSTYTTLETVLSKELLQIGLDDHGIIYTGNRVINLLK